MSVTSSDALAEAAANDGGWRRLSAMLIDGTTARVYERRVADGTLRVLVSREQPHGWHMSISHRCSDLAGPDGGAIPGRIPTWEEICEARYRFVPDAVYMAQILPPRREYVNLMATAMHLWELPAEVAR